MSNAILDTTKIHKLIAEGESLMSEVSQDIVETVTVFDRECVKITSDEELDNLGHDVALVRLHNMSIYVYQDDCIIIQATYTSRHKEWSVSVGDFNGEGYPTLTEAMEDIKDRIDKQLAYITHIRDMISKPLRRRV